MKGIVLNWVWDCGLAFNSGVCSPLWRLSLLKIQTSLKGVAVIFNNSLENKCNEVSDLEFNFSFFFFFCVKFVGAKGCSGNKKKILFSNLFNYKLVNVCCSQRLVLKGLPAERRESWQTQIKYSFQLAQNKLRFIGVESCLLFVFETSLSLSVRSSFSTNLCEQHTTIC